MKNEIMDLVKKLCGYKKFSLGKFLLHSTVKTLCKKYVTESIRLNAEFQNKAGLKPKIIRTSKGNCCNWCNEVVGEYRYPNVPKEIYRRHRGCTCTVEYFPGDGRVQNVHTREWYSEESRKAKSNYHRMQNVLNENEETAINQYISSEAYKINDKLRRKIELNDSERLFVKNLDSALNKMDNFEGDLYRVVDFTGFPNCEELTKEFIDKFKKGDRIKFKEYISTSKEIGYNDNANVFIYIKNAKNGKDISRFNPGEREVLYKRGTSFKTKSIKVVDSKHFIVVEEV